MSSVMRWVFACYFIGAIGPNLILVGQNVRDQLIWSVDRDAGEGDEDERMAPFPGKVICLGRVER